MRPSTCSASSEGEMITPSLSNHLRDKNNPIQMLKIKIKNASGLVSFRTARETGKNMLSRLAAPQNDKAAHDGSQLTEGENFWLRGVESEQEVLSRHLTGAHNLTGSTFQLYTLRLFYRQQNFFFLMEGSDSKLK